MLSTLYAFIIGRDRGVNIRVNDASSGDMLNSAFTDGVKAGYGTERNRKIGNDALGQ